MRSRAFRRSQQQRMNKHAENVFRNVWQIDDEDWIKWGIRKFANRLKMCSCMVCGNRRKHEGKTAQELQCWDDW